MKNIHLIPTDKLSRLGYLTKRGKNIFKDLRLFNMLMPNIGDSENQNIYITSNEEIKEGVDQWYLDKVLNKPYNSGCAQYGEKQDVIILTTDQDLINDGVQSIEDEFLEWFVKNPSYENVQILWTIPAYKIEKEYRIEIPNEEQKQHLIDMMRGDEELGLYENWVKDVEKESNLSDLNDRANAFWSGYRAGIKFKKRMYNEEEVISILYEQLEALDFYGSDFKFGEWFEQFKKK